jgi:hypothetical protein
MVRNRAAAAFVVVLAWLHAGTAAGQDFGVLGGLTRASLFSADVWSSGTGFEAGGFVSFHAFERIEVQTELLFVRETAEASLSDGTAEIRSTTTLDYLDIPIQLKRAIHPGSRVAPVVFGGLYIAANTRARAVSHVAANVVEEDIKDLVARWDYGWVAGAGVEIRHGDLTWIADVRFRYGLPQVMKEDVGPEGRARTVGIRGGLKW